MLSWLNSTNCNGPHDSTPPSAASPSAASGRRHARSSPIRCKLDTSPPPAHSFSMVAETAPNQAPQAQLTRKKGGRKKGDSAFPLLTRLKARNLYVIQGATHETIAQQTGMTTRQSEALASRSGWTKIRRAKEASLVATQDARAHDQITEAMEAIASVSEQHAMQALQHNVPAALERNDKEAARDFQAYTGGVRNLVQTAKICRETSEQGAAEGERNLAVFVLRIGDQVTAKEPAEPKRVTQVELRPDEAKAIP